MTASRIETFKQMLTADPENSVVRFGLANELLKAERYDEAITELNEYLARGDDEGAAYGMLARALTSWTSRRSACNLRARRASVRRPQPSFDGRGLPNDFG